MIPKKMLLLAPTSIETKWITDEVILTGIGPYKCAASVARVISEQCPDLLILCGIAGAYPDSGLVSGDTVLVETEHAADLGSFQGETFLPKFCESYTCSYIGDDVPFAKVQSNSVSGASAPFVRRDGVQIENMEGAAFFYTCLQYGVPFLELRSISNRVGDPFSMWDLSGAAKSLADSLRILIKQIENHEIKA